MGYKKQYNWHKFDARARGIPFLLDYSTWLKIWVDSGHLHERGHKKGQYCMARFGDKGPYAVGNVKIVTCSENISEGQLNKPKSEATKQKMRQPKSASDKIRLAIHCKKLGRAHRKLTDEQEIEIASHYVPGKKGCTLRALAAKFNITEALVSGAIQRSKRVV